MPYRERTSDGVLSYIEPRFPEFYPNPNINPYTHRNEKQIMSKESRAVHEALAAVQDAQVALGAAKQSLERARKNYPEFHLMQDDTVIAFSLQMDTLGGIRKTYHYAARKVMGRWYTTGSTCPINGHSHQQLIALLDKGTLDGKIKVLS